MSDHVRSPGDPAPRTTRLARIARPIGSDATPTTEARLERLRTVETTVRRARWAAVVFATLQFGLYQPPAGSPLPWPRWLVAFAFIGVLAAINLVSAHLTPRLDEEGLRRLGRIELQLDVATTVLVMVLFSFEPGGQLWTALTVPILEGALREQLRGALVTWFAATAGHAFTEIGRVEHFDLASGVPSVTYGAGILLLVALMTGLLAQRLEGMRDTAQRQAQRLRHLNELASSVAARGRTTEVLDRIAAAGRDLTHFESATFVQPADAAWSPLVGIIEASGRDVLRVPVELLPEGAAAALDHATHVLAALIRVANEPQAVLVLGTSDETAELGEDDHDLVGLLAAQAAIALDNARVLEAEARTIAELRQLDEIKDDFVSVMAHDIRSPMTSISGFAGLLRSRWDELEPDKRDQMLRTIEAETQRLVKLVGDVQQVIQADQQALPNEPTILHLPAVIAEVAEHEVSPSPIHQLALTVGPSVPPVWADGDRLRQVLHNVLSNAVRYSPEGGSIDVMVRGLQDDVEITVADHGVGLPADAQDRLFTKFGRISNSRRIKGTGLGLYLSRALVEAMHGTISIASPGPDLGTTVKITLPAAPAEGVPLEPAADARGLPTR